MFKWVGAVLLSVCLVSQVNAEWTDMGDGVFIDTEDLRMIPNGFQFHLATNNPEATSWVKALPVSITGNPVVTAVYEVDCKAPSMSVASMVVWDEEGDDVISLRMGDYYRPSIMHHYPPNFSKQIKDICQYYGFKV